MYRFATLLFLIAFVTVLGCGKPTTGDVTKDASVDEKAEYERMVAESEKANENQ